MLDTKIKVLGLLILVGAILLLVGAFTPCWIAIHDDYWSSDSKCFGDSVFWGGNYWVDLASWLILISIGVYLVIFFAYYKAVRKVRKHGYCRRFKKWFGIVAVLAVIAAFLMLFSVISSLISLSNTDYAHLGYSGWITFSSGIITVAIALYSGYVVFKQQWQATPNFQTVQVVQQPQTVQMVPVVETAGVQLTGTATVVSTQVPQNQMVVSQVSQGVVPQIQQGVVNQAYQIAPAAAAQPAQNPQATVQITQAPQVVTQYQVVPNAPSAPPTKTVYTVYPAAQ
ncbi:unnamed protein product [Caenorhabditis brenneri]